MNKAILIGNLGTEPEYRQVGEGGVLNLSVATSEKYKDREGNLQEKTEWHRVSYWGKGAQALSGFLQKGGKVAIEGSIHTREYEKDGQKRYATEIKAFHVENLERKKAAEDGDRGGW